MSLPFAPAIRGKWTHEAGGTTGNKRDFFQGNMQHKTWQDITAEMDSTRRMWRHQSFFVHCTPTDAWELEPGFRQCYHLIDDIVLTGLIIIEKLLVLHYFHQKWCCKKDVLKLVQCVCACEQFWRCGVQNIHRSFVGWTGGAPHSHHFRRLRGLFPFARRKPTAARRLSGKKAPEVGRRSTWRRATATSRLRSFCSRKAPRWTPRTTAARASIREGARHRVSPTWGASKKCWDQMITSSMFMNDHNAILDINFVYIYIILYLKTSFRWR